jgi:respiratory nitrate reductase gamma subunit
MNELFLFGVFPYAALAVAGVGVAARYRNPATLGTRSSEFLEKRVLFWGSVPWHYAILAILAAHLFAAVAPGAWGSLLADPRRLVVLEIAGVALGIWATFAVALLIVRRATSARLRVVTTWVDWLVLALLLAQVATGTWIGLTLRWGSVWYLHTAAPWLGSLFSLAPRTELASVLPALVKFHAIGAFILLALLPFSRLVHALSVPLGYLWRPFQVVVWNRIARRNLWISIPALLLAFAVWMVWSVVVVKLPAVGFKFTTDQLFWLAALPGCPAPRCASSTRSWCRSSAAGAGPRSAPRRC